MLRQKARASQPNLEDKEGLRKQSIAVVLESGYATAPCNREIWLASSCFVACVAAWHLASQVGEGGEATVERRSFRSISASPFCFECPFLPFLFLYPKLAPFGATKGHPHRRQRWSMTTYSIFYTALQR